MELKYLTEYKNNRIDKVKMTVFYETLCPGSRHFFTHQLPKLFANESKLYRHVNFDFVPFGKAHVSSTYLIKFLSYINFDFKSFF